MAIDKNSNGFTFTFAIVMVAVVGTILAVLYSGLKPFQDENVRREKMQDILSAMNVKVKRDEAPAVYEKTIKKAFLVDANGKLVEGVNTDPTQGEAFALDVRKQFRDERARVITADQMKYPVYVAEKDGRPLYILPVVGTGLWGPIGAMWPWPMTPAPCWAAPSTTRGPGTGGGDLHAHFHQPIPGQEDRR